MTNMIQIDLQRAFGATVTKTYSYVKGFLKQTVNCLKSSLQLIISD